MFIFSKLSSGAECEHDLFTYFCLNLYGVCTDSGEVVRPCSNLCESLRTGACAAKWVKLKALLRSLPTEAADRFKFLDCASQSNKLTCNSKSPAKSYSYVLIIHKGVPVRRTQCS